LSAERSGYSTWEFPISKAVKYFLRAWIIGIVCGVVLTVIAFKTDWYQQLGRLTLSFLTVNWWVSPFLLGSFIFIVWLNRLTKKNKSYGRY